MNKKLISRKAAEVSVFFGLLCAVFMSAAHFEAACDDLRANVLRLHIIANSDSEADQALKLEVRDRILRETEDIFKNSTSVADAERAVSANLERFESTALSVIEENGFGYSADAYVGNSYFETREYEDFTLPAGNYRSLIIRLGEGKGHNWWCVVFPTVCIPAASDAELSDSTSETSAEIAEHPQKYVMKFKAVEIYEKIKKIFE